MVLVDTSHPGNIGAAARAMKNMELDDLRAGAAATISACRGQRARLGRRRRAVAGARVARRCSKHSRAAAWCWPAPHATVTTTTECSTCEKPPRAPWRRACRPGGRRVWRRAQRTQQRRSGAGARAVAHSDRQGIRFAQPGHGRASGGVRNFSRARRCGARWRRASNRSRIRAPWSGCTRIWSRCWTRSTFAIAPSRAPTS